MDVILPVLCIGLTVAFLLMGVKANQEDEKVQSASPN
jgi:hypothetical protein